MQLHLTEKSEQESEQEPESKSGVEENSGRVGENPCDSEEVWVKIVNADTVTCVDKDTAKSWIESDFAVMFNGELGQRPEQQKPEQQEPEQRSEQQEPTQDKESNSEVSSNIVAENSCDSGQVPVKIINDDVVRCIEKATADLWIEGDFAVAFDGKSEQNAVQQTDSKLGDETSSETENPCDSNEVQIKLIRDDTVRCVEKDVADSWIEGNFAVAFDEESEEQSKQQEAEQEDPEQEAKSESDSEDSSGTAEKISCDPDKVRVKIVNADSVVCVDEDTANSWIESDFAVKF